MNGLDHLQGETVEVLASGQAGDAPWLTVRAARAEDLGRLLELTAAFCAESNLPAAFSFDRARDTLARAIAAPHVDVLVVEVDDPLHGATLAGGAIIVTDDEFTEAPFAIVNKFYVDARWRGYGAGLHLVQGAIAAAKARGAAALYASATAGIDERTEALFVALFRRAGFEVLGRIVWRAL